MISRMEEMVDQVEMVDQKVEKRGIGPEMFSSVIDTVPDMSKVFCLFFDSHIVIHIYFGCNFSTDLR